MGDIIKGIEFLGIPATTAIALIGLFLVLQVIGELCELKGKIVPEFLKIRKYFKRKKEDREDKERTLKEVKLLLSDVNRHYSEDNIAKRNSWMKGVDNRAITCGNQMDEIKNTLLQVTQALNTNTKMTEDLFIENSRDRIIDFAEKASDHNIILSHEQFRRIFRVYECYEDFLKEHNRTNGEVDIAHAMIQDGFKYRMQNHCFAEDLKGYIKK